MEKWSSWYTIKSNEKFEKKKKKKIEAVDGWYWDYDIEFEFKIYKKKKGKKKDSRHYLPTKADQAIGCQKGNRFSYIYLAKSVNSEG